MGIEKRSSINNKFSKISNNILSNPKAIWDSYYQSSFALARNDLYLILLYRSYLIGWYWNDRGVGEVLHNMAIEGGLGGGLLPHLDITLGAE